jgi:hypothetical protein
MKNALSLFIILVIAVSVSAQDGGMRIYAGTSSLVNKDIIANPEGFSHSGYHFGADGRLMSGGMAFLVGGRYTSVSRIAIQDFKLSGHESTLSVMNGRVGLDFSIYSFTHNIRIRTKALASFDIVLSQTGTAMPPPGFELNDGWLGLVTGLGVDIGPAILDIEYEFGFVNAYNKKKKSAFDSLSISVGFFF